MSKKSKVSKKTLFSIVTSTLINSTNTSASSIKELRINTEDYSKIEFLLENNNNDIEFTILSGLKDGTIILDNDGNVKVNRTYTELLNNHISNSYAGESTVCSRTGQ